MIFLSPRKKKSPQMLRRFFLCAGTRRQAEAFPEAGTLGLERVSFEGFCAPAPYYRDAAIFCMTSAFEGFPMVLLEAAAFGCVPVAFDSYAAVRDIIDDGENGVLVSAFDLDAYTETLAQLMRDDALRERLALAARGRVAEFSPDKIAARWEALFAEIA